MTRREQSLFSQIEEEVLSHGSLATALRKCLALGGQAGSTDLREWSSRELKGYGPNEELPSYRVIPAVIKVDAIKGNYQVTGQQISSRQLPDVAQDKVGEEVGSCRASGRSRRWPTGPHLRRAA